MSADRDTSGPPQVILRDAAAVFVHEAEPHVGAFPRAAACSMLTARDVGAWLRCLRRSGRDSGKRQARAERRIAAAFFMSVRHLYGRNSHGSRRTATVRRPALPELGRPRVEALAQIMRSERRPWKPGRKLSRGDFAGHHGRAAGS